MVDSQPLLGVKAYVDVRSQYANHSHAVSDELRKLGAVICDKLLPTVTHIIFKDGSKTTEAKARKFGIHIVSVNWVESCKKADKRVEEHAYSLLNCSTGKKKQKSMQPKDFNEEFQRVSDKLTRAKKRRSDVHIPPPLSIIADRINLNCFIKAPRTPPAMQRKLDELRERNASGCKPAACRAAAKTDEETNKPLASLGTSPTLPTTHPAEALVLSTAHKADVSLREDRVVPETPLSWNISARLSLSPSPEKNVTIPPVIFDSPDEAEHVAKSIENSPDPQSPTLQWDTSINSFLNQRVTSNSAVQSSIQLNRRSFSSSNETIDMLDNSSTNGNSASPAKANTDQTRPITKTNLSENISLPKTDAIANNVAKSYPKKRKSFVPPFLKPNKIGFEKLPGGAEKTVKVSVTEAARPFKFIEGNKPKSVSDLLALHSQVISDNHKNNHKQNIPQESKTSKRKSAVTSNNSNGKLKESVRFLGEDSPDIESLGFAVKGIRKTNSKVKSEPKSQELSKTSVLNLNNNNKMSIKSTSPAVIPSLSSSSSPPTNHSHSCTEGTSLVLIKENSGQIKTRPRNAKIVPTSSSACLESDSSLLLLDQLQLSNLSKSSKVSFVSESGKEKVAIKKRRTGRSVGGSKENTPNDAADNNSTSVGSKHHSRRQSRARRDSAALTELSNQSVDCEMTNCLSVNDDKIIAAKDDSIDRSVSVNKDDEIWMFDSRPVTSALDNNTSSTSKSRSHSLRAESRKTSMRSKPRSHSECATLTRGTRSTAMPNLVLTSLHSGDRSVVKSIIKKLGGYHINVSVDQNTTHVVCGNSRRTMNALKGISYGCWVVSVDWVMMSLEAGMWVESEENYLMVLSFPGASLQRRQNIMADGNKLFASVGAIYVSQGTTPSTAELSELVTLNGGKLVRTRRACDIMIGTASEVSAHSAVVKENWILDCVTNQRLMDPRPYQWSADLSSDSDVFE